MSALVILLLQVCPTAADVRPGVDYLAVPAGCPAPGAGVWFTRAAFDQIRQDRADAAARLEAERRLKAKARTERDRCRSSAVAQIASLRVALEQASADLRAAGAELRAAGAELLRCSSPPSRATWSLLGAGAGAAACAAGALLW